jgi:large subunit ribosomal protein L18
MALTKTERRSRIKRRVRTVVSGTADRPRLSVFRSNKQIYVQLIDDNQGNTILTVSSKDKDIAEKEGSKSEKAAMVGKIVAEKAKASGINEVVFDRNGYLYHGRVKQLADAARKGGLKF